MTNQSEHYPEAVTEATLEGWKEVATYLNRTERTVKRWEKEEGLPVRRHQHQARASVYAYPSELDAWLAARQPAAEQPSLWFRRPASALATAAALLLALASVASGPLANPPDASAEEPGVVVRQVWTGEGKVDYLGSVSPDGRYLSFTDWSTGDLKLRVLSTGENRHVTDKGTWSEAVEFAHESRFSPNGKQLAYSWYRDGAFEVRVTSVEEPAPRLLYRNERHEYISVHDWSSDGRYLAVVLFDRADNTSQIALMSAADGFVKVLKSLDWRYPDNLRFSPDDRYLAYDLPPDSENPHRDIYLLATDGSREIPLVKHPADDAVLDWSPQGETLLFESDRTGTNGAWMVQFDGGQPQGFPELVQRDLGETVFPLGFARKGEFYYGVASSTREAYTARLDLEKGEAVEPPSPVSQKFIGSNAAPEWSPDGKSLAYIHLKDSNPWLPATIVIRSLTTGEERQLYPELKRLMNKGPGQRLALRWSSDGKKLLVVGADRKNRHGLFLIDVETGETTPAVLADAGGHAVRYGRWSADGNALFFVRGPGHQQEPRIVKRSLETGAEEVLYRSDFQLFDLAVSPNGEWLAFSEWNREGEAGKETQDVKVIPSQGGEARLLFQVPLGEKLLVVGWTPQGGEVLFIRNPQNARKPAAYLWAVAAQGGEPRKLELGMNVLDNIRFHPDGRQVAFDSGQSRAEIWVLKNFLPEVEVAQAE